MQEDMNHQRYILESSGNTQLKIIQSFQEWANPSRMSPRRPVKCWWEDLGSSSCHVFPPLTEQRITSSHHPFSCSHQMMACPHPPCDLGYIMIINDKTWWILNFIGYPLISQHSHDYHYCFLVNHQAKWLYWLYVTQFPSSTLLNHQTVGHLSLILDKYR